MPRFDYGAFIAIASLALGACAIESDENEYVEGDGDVAGEGEEVATTSDALTASQKKAVRDDIIEHGQKHRGAPYVFGASTSTTKEFDCSSFVKHLYASEAGITLPRTSRDQAKRGREVSFSALEKGDLVFFKSTSRPVPVDHVAIYAGNDRLLHTYRVGVGVTFTRFSGYWRNRAVSARDVIGR